MKLEGSCHCGAVRFSLESQTPYPFMYCYCSICRKTSGGGGYATNLMGWADPLEVEGEDSLAVYQARMDRPGDDPDPEISPARRHFCRGCGSALWLFDPRWPELVHPHASAIDTPLPRPPERVHIMLDYAASWVEVPKGKREHHFRGYPDEGIEDWHRVRGLFDPPAPKGPTRPRKR